MEPLGILLYGYGEEEAQKIKEFLESLLQKEVLLLSASGQEEAVVREILAAEEATFFEEKETKILMFLGFDGKQIKEVLQQFPQDGTLPRPIFCGLTAQNVQWPLSDLLDHLLEEHRQWSQNKGQSTPSPGPEKNKEEKEGEEEDG